MSRPHIFIILGIGLALLAIIGGAVLLVRSFLTIDDVATVIATPIAVVEPLLTPTDIIITPTEEATPATLVTPTPPAEASPTSGGETACTNTATLVADMSIPDDSEIRTGTLFVKTWRIRNSGTCIWDSSYKLAHVDGHLLGADYVQQMALPHSVGPGQTIDLSVLLTAPTAAGSYRGDWKLVTPQNNLFGVGSNNAPLWVKIKVLITPTQDTTISGLVYQDRNKNGGYDDGEQLMGNREVHLIEGTRCHVLLEPTATTLSDADGRYHFVGRFMGNYCVGLRNMDGMEDVIPVTIIGGQVVTDANLRILTPDP